MLLLILPILLSYVGSPSNVCQPPDHIIICRVESRQTAIQLHQRARVNNVRHSLLALDQRNTGPSPLDAISFYWQWHHNVKMQYRVRWKINITIHKTSIPETEELENGLDINGLVGSHKELTTIISLFFTLFIPYIIHLNVSKQIVTTASQTVTMHHFTAELNWNCSSNISTEKNNLKGVIDYDTWHTLTPRGRCIAGFVDKEQFTVGFISNNTTATKCIASKLQSS